MSWNSSYETGIDEIDRQNFNLISYIEVMTNSKDNRARLAQLEIFEELVKNYFECEQRLHDECCYFDAYRHRIFHEAYIITLQGIKQNFEKTGATAGNEKLFRNKAVDFLKNHITGRDKSFARFYQNNIFRENYVENENLETSTAV